MCEEKAVNEMEIFRRCSARCSGVKCVTLPGGDREGEGGGVVCNGTPVTYRPGGPRSRWVCLY